MGKEPTHRQNSMSSNDDDKVSMPRKEEKKKDTERRWTRLYSRIECPKSVLSTDLAGFN